MQTPKPHALLPIVLITMTGCATTPAAENATPANCGALSTATVDTIWSVVTAHLTDGVGRKDCRAAAVELELCLAASEHASVRLAAPRIVRSVVDPGAVAWPPRTLGELAWHKYKRAAEAAIIYQRLCGDEQKAKTIEIVSKRYMDSSAYLRRAAGIAPDNDPARPPLAWDE